MHKDYKGYLHVAKSTSKLQECKKMCSQTGNRTPAAAVRAPNPNHQTTWEVKTSVPLASFNAQTPSKSLLWLRFCTKHRFHKPNVLSGATNDLHIATLRPSRFGRFLSKPRPCWLNGRDRIVVSTSRCGRDNPGSNPGHGRGCAVSIMAFQPDFQPVPLRKESLQQTK